MADRIPAPTFGKARSNPLSGVGRDDRKIINKKGLNHARSALLFYLFPLFYENSAVAGRIDHAISPAKTTLAFSFFILTAFTILIFFLFKPYFSPYKVGPNIAIF